MKFRSWLKEKWYEDEKDPSITKLKRFHMAGAKRIMADGHNTAYKDTTKRANEFIKQPKKRLSFAANSNERS